MPFLSLVVFDGEKYLAKNLYAKSFHVVIEPRGNEFNYILALSLNKKGNNIILTTSSNTLLYLKVA